MMMMNVEEDKLNTMETVYLDVLANGLMMMESVKDATQLVRPAQKVILATLVILGMP